MKYLKYLFLFLITAVMLSTVCYASSVSDPEQTAVYDVYLDDQAGLLTPGEESALMEELKELTGYGNMMVTTVTLYNSDYQKHCENAYYERYKNEAGVHLQIDMGNRKITLSASTSMEDILGSERDSIVDNIYRYASNGDYYSCIAECFREIRSVINDEKIAHDMKNINNAILAVILGLLLNFIIILFSTGDPRKKSALEKNIVSHIELSSVHVKKGKVEKIYSPSSSSSGGSGGGGGGGGGGFSGGSSSHGF